MTDEKRVARLTELARREWPGAIISYESDGTSVITGIQRDGERTWTAEPVFIRHPRALEALEAVLNVLTGEPPYLEFALRDAVDRVRERLETKRPLYRVDPGGTVERMEPPAWVEDLASKWESEYGDLSVGSQCARELRERAKEGA